MTEQELQAKIKEGKVKQAKPPEGQSEDLSFGSGNATLDGFLPVLHLLRAFREHLQAHPTFVPQNYAESIQFVEVAGTYYVDVYVDGAWRQIQVGVSPATAGITHYEVTSVDITADSTGGDVNAISFTVPANTVADGDVIKIHAHFLFKQDAGTNVTINMKTKWFDGASNLRVTHWGVSIPDDANEYNIFYEFTYQRHGDDLYVYSDGGNSPETRINQQPSGVTAGQILTPDFTVDQAVSIMFTFTSTDSNCYLKPVARAYKINAP